VTGPPADRLAALDAALVRITSGEPAALVRHGLVPGSWRPLLARVAVAGRFDQDVYHQMLATSGAGEPPALGALAGTGLIAPVPGRPGWFSMPEQDRTVWAAELPDDERSRLEGELAQAHLGRGDRLEAMQHLLSSDPERGRELLETLLDEADGELNLPRCQDILRAAAERAGSVGADLAGFIAERTAYLNARSIWLMDYYQSAHFLEPDGLAGRGQVFVAGRTPPVWHLTGQGGAGKSMQLKWLIARHWVPRPAGTPCARIDFDSVDPMACARHPFLVFLMAAGQLAPQLARNPFSHLLRSYEPFLRFAWPRTDLQAPLDPARAAVAAREVPRLFADCCRAAGRPVIVVLDTLEELSLRYPAETAELVRQFAKVAQDAPELRLVFAGRYEIPAVAGRFGKVTVQPVAPFSEAQADWYLQVTRGIDDAGRRSELIRRSNGLPFLLAMYADLVTGDPAIALDSVAAGTEPRLVYLADRIIDRIPQPLVRWLLRYGWVPRRLTRGYVRDVLAPFLIQVGSGDLTLDNPMLDPITEWRGRPLFRTDLPDLQARLDQAWDDLTGYASESSWVTGVAGDPDTIVFKAELLAPMRAVLARQAVLRQLHLRSADYYRELAGADPARRSRFLREAVFHLAQGGASDLLPRWRELSDQARESGDYPALADLCAEVTGPEYVTEAGVPLRRQDLPIVPAELLAEAHLWRAYAAQAQIVSRLKDGTFPGWQDDPLWEVARQELAVARWAPGARSGGRGPLLAHAELLVRGALALADGDPRRAWQAAGELGDERGDIGFCAAALHVAAAPLADQDPIPPLRNLISRGLLARRAAETVAATQTLASGLRATGDLTDAVSLVLLVNREVGSLTSTYLSLLTEQGTPALALRSAVSQERQLDVDWSLARAHLALRQPDQALAIVKAAGRRLEEQPGDPTTRLRERAAYLEMLGIVDGTLLRLAEAADSFQEAASLWRELGHPDGNLRSSRHYAEVLLHEAGDVTAAAKQVDIRSIQWNLALPGDELGGDGEVPAAMRVAAEALGRQAPRPQTPAAIIEQLIAVAGSEHHRSRALAAVAGLVATQDVARFGPVLLEALTPIEPRTAQLRVLEGLRWSAPLPEHPVLAAMDRVAADAVALLEADEFAPEWPEDAAVHHLQRAYVARACGGPGVRSSLASALTLAGPSFLACEVLRHFPHDAPDEAATLAQEYLRNGAHPPTRTLAAVVHLRQAERLAHQEASPAEVDEMLQRADDELESAGRPSRWPAESLALRGVIALSRGQTSEAAKQFAYARTRQERLGDTLAVRTLDDLLSSLGGTEPDDELVLAAWPTDRASELVVRRVPSGDGHDYDVMLAALAGTAEDRAAGRVVRVESVDLDTLALPWELVTPRIYRTQPGDASAGRDIAWLLWARMRSSLPPELREDCRRVINGRRLNSRVRLQVELALPRAGRPPRVIIVRGSEQAESSWGYGHRSRGLDLMSSYLSAGWEAAEYTAGEARRLGQGGRFLHQPADVLHLTGRMETSGALSWFDTSEEELAVRSSAKGSGTDTGIFVTDVVGWLAEMHRSLGEEVPPPVVVLDPVVSSSTSELAGTLAGRNRFAAGLYLDGMTMAVVAAGLIDNDPVAAQQAWLDGVARGDSLEEVVRAIRQVAPPSAPPALFAPSRTFRISPA
jgi:hypothetical protein